MARAYRKGHIGTVVTVARFRMAGFLTVQAGRLAKKVKSCCVFCRYLDHQPISQLMGTFPRERFVNPVFWGDMEMDLMEPYACQGDINKHCIIKVWVAVLEDVNRRAVYCYFVLNYSTKAIILILKQISSV